MKIVSWNLKNIGQDKLSNQFQPAFRAYGLGNNVLDYIVNVVMGADCWADVVSPFPADVFVIIELKTGGDDIGDDVTGTCTNALAAIRDAMNVAVVRLQHSTKEYHYAYARPLITGRNETVGFIYNERVLTATGITAERDTATNTYLDQRTPLCATFSIVEQPATTLRISGVHAPPPASAAAGLRLRPPIDWCVRLASTPTATAGAISFFAGDFNCQPTDTYTADGGAVVGWAAGLAHFQSGLPNNTLTSVRVSLATGVAGKARYLSAPYDSAICDYAAPTTMSDQDVPDLIGGAKNANAEGAALYPGHGLGVFNAFRAVSDHLPVVTEFNVL